MKLTEYANWKSGQVESLVILWVRPPLRSLVPPPGTARARRPKGRCQHGMLEIRVRVPASPLTVRQGSSETNGREPDTVGRAVVLTRFFPREIRVRIPSLPHGRSSATRAEAIRLDGETEIIPRFERGVPGSNPGRGIFSNRRQSISTGTGGANPPWATGVVLQSGSPRQVRRAQGNSQKRMSLEGCSSLSRPWMDKREKDEEPW